MEKLRAYISVVKDRFHPTLGDDASILLERHYEKCRMSGSSTIPVTVRFLESMIRLSQAHARLMYRSDVTLDDAVAVVRIMECSAFAYGGYDGNVDDIENILYCDPMTIDFSPLADEDFEIFMFRILDRYNLLDRMPSERRDRAASHTKSEGSDSYWNTIENPRDYVYGANVQEDHYGRIHFQSQVDTQSINSDRKRRKSNK